ncbi:DTW domain protein [Marinomonas spartinae]|uniref:tRNA-uridine aminocarboxypropyltransferase n=1 Tax=Marinomonas spartinae TaxID=1792290 RepID=A0A1A8TKQ3_9GAMM|nr:tRNA-uridine aminocarboxypropyltransferase [Marinomonas spartinae]SBS26696.1 DTW domain protein [Marinomonas spartinae]SBS32938.1 DTW domain protein [Marinomonas spartinae]
MKIWLLTHSEETKKKTGTGKLVKEALADECNIVEWSRVLPNKEILNLDISNTILLYPQEESTQESTSLKDIDNVIILDGTWQQARKMYNQSPYLKSFPHYEIQGKVSEYTKRRNQKNMGLCTAETVIHLLQQKGHNKAINLKNRFDDFNK